MIILHKSRAQLHFQSPSTINYYHLLLSIKYTPIPAPPARAGAAGGGVSTGAAGGGVSTGAGGRGVGYGCICYG